MHTRSILPLAALAIGCSEHEIGTFNTAPAVSIVFPLDGDIFEPAELVELYGIARDSEEDASSLEVFWTSDIDGGLGEGVPDENGDVYLAVSNLTPGLHAIVLSAYDSEGDAGETAIQIDMGGGDDVEIDDDRPSDPSNTAPTATISSPRNDDSFSATDAIIFEGLVLDGQSDSMELDVTWASDRDGELFYGTPDSDGYSAFAERLTEGTHVVTLVVTDPDGAQGGDTIVIDVVEGTDFDEDGDGYSESDGDCDDQDVSIHPDASEQCDFEDNDCDGLVNEDWMDDYEPNEEVATDLGELDSWDWSSGSASLEDLSLHSEDDIDFFMWDADDDYYDDVDVEVTVSDLPSTGSYAVALYLWESDTWVEKDIATGARDLTVEYAGSQWNQDEDYWLVAVYAVTWEENTCSQTYEIDVRS